MKDAFRVTCDFKTGETCIYPNKATLERKKWVQSAQDGFKWMVEELTNEKVTFFHLILPHEQVKVPLLKIHNTKILDGLECLIAEKFKHFCNFLHVL